MPVPRRALGPSAEFRDGQLAATRATWNSAAVFWSCNIPAAALIEQELLGPLLYRALRSTAWVQSVARWLNLEAK